MAKIGFSDIVAIDVDMGVYGGKNFANSEITANHVCINDSVLAFDANNGFNWTTSDGNVYIQYVTDNVTGVTARLYFGIPIN